MNKIKEMFQPRCVHRHTERTHPKCFQNGKPTLIKEDRDSRVLIFDVETLPIIAAVWKVWEENVSEPQIIQDWCILSWSAKWLYDDKIMSDVLTPKEAIARNDKRLLESFWELLNKADVVIAHNGKRFDIKKVNTRLWKHRMKRPSSYKVIDTLSSVKSVFSLNHNGQDSIAKFLEIQEKLDTNFQLWMDCHGGNLEALKYMVEYNEHDVRMLEEIYLSMREWIPNHPDLRIYKGAVEGCPVCLENDSKEIGGFPYRGKLLPEHRCNVCGSVWHDTKVKKE